MSKKPPCLDGRIEYDNWLLNFDPAYCTVRLSLFDLPPGAIVCIHLSGELERWLGYSFGRDRLIAWQIKERLGYTDTFQIRPGGSLQIEVYRSRQSARAGTPEHAISYRIDAKQQRPVRKVYEPYRRAQLYMTDELRKPPYQYIPPLAKSAPAERGSWLWLCEASASTSTSSKEGLCYATHA